MNGNSVFTTQKMRDCWTNKCENFMHDDGLDLFFLDQRNIRSYFVFCLFASKILYDFVTCHYSESRSYEGPNIQSYFIDDFLPYFLGSIAFLSFGTWYKMVHISSIIVQRPQNIFVKVLCITFSGLARLFCQAWKTCLSLLLFSLNAH